MALLAANGYQALAMDLPGAHIIRENMINIDHMINISSTVNLVLFDSNLLLFFLEVMENLQIQSL